MTDGHCATHPLSCMCRRQDPIKRVTSSVVCDEATDREIKLKSYSDCVEDGRTLKSTCVLVQHLCVPYGSIRKSTHCCVSTPVRLLGSLWDLHDQHTQYTHEFR